MAQLKTIIITGANSGLGYECAANIAPLSEDYHIILACRNKEKGEQARTEIINKSNNPNVTSMELDLSSFASVRNFVGAYKKLDLPPLYGLICNAGINGTHTGQTADGFDIIFQSNHLGHFFLVNLLLPYMHSSGRILVVSSDMHNPPGPALTWQGAEALAYPDENLSKNFLRYSYSKLCNLYFCYGLAEKLTRLGSGIQVNALNPGLMVDTGFSPDKTRFTKEFLETVADRIGSLPVSSKALAQLCSEPGIKDIERKSLLS